MRPVRKLTDALAVPSRPRRGAILVIDDDELVARTIKRLPREQHDVVTERDPETAAQFLEKPFSIGRLRAVVDGFVGEFVG